MEDVILSEISKRLEVMNVVVLIRCGRLCKLVRRCSVEKWWLDIEKGEKVSEYIDFVYDGY